MEITLELIVFTVLAVFTAVSAVLAVTTKRILRAATYLLFVLFGTAGIYFQLNYSFLGAVQLLIYAGGITVLYVFSILLTSSQGDKSEDIKGYKLFVGLAATLLSLGVYVVHPTKLPMPGGYILSNNFLWPDGSDNLIRWQSKALFYDFLLTLKAGIKHQVPVYRG